MLCSVFMSGHLIATNQPTGQTPSPGMVSQGYRVTCCVISQGANREGAIFGFFAQRIQQSELLGPKNICSVSHQGPASISSSIYYINLSQHLLKERSL